LSCVAFIDFLLIRNEEKNPSCMWLIIVVAGIVCVSTEGWYAFSQYFTFKTKYKNMKTTSH
jgi:hypothetical protein